MSRRIILCTLMPMGFSLLLACGGGEGPTAAPTATVGAAAVNTAAPDDEVRAALTAIAGAAAMGTAASRSEVDEVTAFLEGYIEAIAVGDFEAVVGRYLVLEQVLNMAQGMADGCAGGDGTCVQGLIASGRLEEIWRGCCSIWPEAARGFRVLQVRRLSTDEYLAIYNFFDEHGQVIGAEVHPQWAAGRTMHVFRQPDGSLHCDSYYFFE